MSANIEKINELIGSSVYEVSKGVGSFFNIYSKSISDDIFQFWIYQCEWAITESDKEINSSDIVDDFNFKLIQDSLIGKKYSEISILDSNEIHFTFDNFSLEVWVENLDNNSKEMGFIYKNRRYYCGVLTPLA